MSDDDTIGKGLTRIVWLVILMFAGSSGVGADDRVVKRLNVLGTAIVHEKNLADAKQNAVNDALVSAVGQVVMETLTGETVVRRFKVINDNILADRDTYIQNYRVLTESVSGTAVRVLVQADVAADRVNQDLARLGLGSAETVYPKVLFAVAERNGADAGFTYWWGDRHAQDRAASESAMAAEFQASGFVVIDPSNLNSPPGLSVNATDTELLALARQLGGEVLITGAATVAAATGSTGENGQSVEAVAEVRAVDVETGQIIGRTRQHSATSGPDAAKTGREALSRAGSLAGEALGRQIVAVWQQHQDRGATVEVVVEGTSGHIASFVRLRTVISSLSGVNTLKMKTMSADRATMAVSYQGSTQSLADALRPKTYSGFTIDITAVSSDTVYIRLVHR
ncbi:MAG: hypothetical protein WBY88_07750 [Desulfosarcina sp.]